MVAVSSSSIETHPQDSPPNMIKDVETFGGRLIDSTLLPMNDIHMMRYCFGEICVQGMLCQYNPTFHAGYTFPFVYDESQETAKVNTKLYIKCQFSFQILYVIRVLILHSCGPLCTQAYLAACTPEFYVFDNNLKLTYHGQVGAVPYIANYCKHPLYISMHE